MTAEDNARQIENEWYGRPASSPPVPSQRVVDGQKLLALLDQADYEERKAVALKPR